MAVPIGRLLRELADAKPDFPAVTCGDVTRTRAELEARSNRLARAYEKLGVGEGDFVTIALPNSVEYFEVALAAWKLGAVPAPVSPKLPVREREAIVELADPKLVVGVPEGSHGRRQCVPEGFEPDASLSDEPVEPDRVSPAWKAPTSGGSTGRPKLIVAGRPAEFEPNAGEAMRMRPDGVQLVPGPLYHNAPFTVATLGLVTGNHLVVLPKFDAVAALDAIEKHRVEMVNFVPTMMLRILRAVEEEPGRWDLRSLQAVWHTAAACPPWVKEGWIDLLGPEHVFEIYGGTENQAFTVITGTEWLEHRGSVGRPAFGLIKVLGAEGEELPPGEVGEIWMRSPDESPRMYRYIGAEAQERDGWESLGDLGWTDEDGYLYLSDRRVDLIVAGGVNIYPAEVEAALLEHPQVQSAVVVGVPDAELGQRVHAVVQAEAAIDEDELRAFLGERLVRYKVPRSFRFVDEVLRDDAGKARRSEIREREAALLGGGEVRP